MRYSTAYVRCDLCGRFANKSVTERSPPHKVDETKICTDAAPAGTQPEPGDTLVDGEVKS